MCKLMTDTWAGHQTTWSPALNLTARVPRLSAQTRMPAQRTLTLKAKSVTESHVDLSIFQRSHPQDTDDRFNGLIQFLLVWLLFLKIKDKQDLQTPGFHGPNCQLSCSSLDQQSCTVF